MINEKMYKSLSYSWGIVMTLIGQLVSIVLKLIGFKPHKFAWCTYFEIGEGWGGLEIGNIFICCKDADEELKKHEFGHTIQNCILGPFTPFLITIPSAIRYWYREWKLYRGDTELPPYDSIWFEGWATSIGTKYVDKINTLIV